MRSMMPAAILAVVLGLFGAVETGSAQSGRPLTRGELVRGQWVWTCRGGNPFLMLKKFRRSGVVDYCYFLGGDKPRCFSNARWSFRDGELLVNYNRGFAIDRYRPWIRRGVIVGEPAHTRPCGRVRLELKR